MRMCLLAGTLLAVPLGFASAASPLPSQDQSFIEQAAVGGMTEVQEGQLAVSKAKAADVKQFGRQMVADHTPNNQLLITLAQQKGVTLPAALDAKHAEQLAVLQKISSSAFDKAYVTGQIAGHKEMVAVLQTEIQGGTDPDLKAFAQKTLPVVQEHLRMAQQLPAHG